MSELHETMTTIRTIDKERHTQEEIEELRVKFPCILSGLDAAADAKRAESKLGLESPIFSQGGVALADLTIGQSLFRKLEVGEVRADLVRRIATRIVRRKWHTPSPCVLVSAQQIVGPDVKLGLLRSE